MPGVAPGVVQGVTGGGGRAPAPQPRVAGYVVRRVAGGGFELLVFDHAGDPASGTQVPAGGIRPAESRREAVLREVREETGVRARVLTELGVIESPHPQTGARRRTSYWLLASGDDRPSWRHRVTAEDPVIGDDDLGDAGMEFDCYWLPLPLRYALADDQGALLGRALALLPGA